MDRARGGLEPYGRMGRTPPAPSLPIPRYPFVYLVDPSPETLWQEIANLVPSSQPILFPALTEEGGEAAVMKGNTTHLPLQGLSYALHPLACRTTAQSDRSARRLGRGSA